MKGRRVRKKVGTCKQIALLALKDAVVKAARDEFGFTRNDISLDKSLGLFLEYSRTNHQPKTTARYRAVVDHFKDNLATNTKIQFISQVKTEVIDQYDISVVFNQPLACCVGTRGDVNADGNDLDIVDLTTVADFLFGVTPPIPCPDESDVNGDSSGLPDIVDLTFIVDYLFGVAPTPVPCP